MKDFTLTYGPEVVLTPQTFAGRAWMDDHLVVLPERRRGEGVAIDACHLDGVVIGFLNDGLTVTTH